MTLGAMQTPPAISLSLSVDLFTTVLDAHSRSSTALKYGVCFRKAQIQTKKLVNYAVSSQFLRRVNAWLAHAWQRASKAVKLCIERIKISSWSG